ncbi:hypothetical protein ACGFZQ_12200 [Streptomyces sp. NPDC048254]|uniref:hypothetical protein n=1 Tax=Streptomyces sp. NPDC048254 TaxID=3365525 RepID=UPI003719BB3C
MRIRHALTGAAMGAVLTLGTLATPAQAASLQGNSAVAHVNETRNFSDIPSPAVLYGRYATLSECISIGSNGEFHGRWLSWYCYDNRPIDVQLWVQYS